MWRSAGWPFQDLIETDLLAARLLARAALGRETEGIAQPQEIPETCGVMLARPGGLLDAARPAPRRAVQLPFAVGMALARAPRLRPIGGTRVRSKRWAAATAGRTVTAQPPDPAMCA